jgi:transcriptional regulator with GAF, ATPase, and Fis domain
VRGAFTGAVADKIGLFEAADGGILLLDEVGEMTPRAQVKLLRILELGEVRRVGETRTRRVQVRVVAATNSDLLGGLRDGTFRLDLYYRLCALRICLPPLRERLGDVPLLALHFSRIFTPAGEPPPILSPEALDRLMGHAWPGNVRELRFTIERAIALTSALGRSRIEADCISIDTTGSSTSPSRQSEASDVAAAGGLEAYIENTERRLILKALEDNGWNRTRAARSLGSLSRTTLIGKMKRLGLFPSQEETRAEDDER